MLKKLAAGLLAAAVITAPVFGGLVTATPAAAATAKTKVVKAHRKHVRHFRIVQCYLSGSQARHVRHNAGKRLQLVKRYLPTKVAKAHGRKHVPAIKHVKPATKPATGRIG